MDGHITVVDFPTETSLKIFITSTLYATMTATLTARPVYSDGILWRRDLSTVIKHAQKRSKTQPNHTQRHHLELIHADAAGYASLPHPNGSARSGSGSSDNEGEGEKSAGLASGFEAR
jgi:hypothetical protein